MNNGLPTKLLLVLLCLLVLSVPLQVRADVGCSASMTTMNFGTVDPSQTGSAITSTASMQFTCTNNSFYSARVTLCMNIGAGGSAGGQTSPWRTMDGPGGTSMQFQLYKNAAHSQVWGSEFTPGTPNPLQVQFTVPGFFGSGTYNSPTYTLYGLIPVPQTGTQTGNYLNSFSGINASISGQYINGGNTYPADCGGSNSGITFPFNVTANVQPACTVTATDMNFGNAGLLDSGGPHDATSSIGVTCVSGTAWKIGLDNGMHASGNTRRMQGPGGYVQYELYRDNGRSQRWGNNPGTDTVNGTGNGGNQNRTVYGRVPSQITPSAGTYSDTITVSVTY